MSSELHGGRTSGGMGTPPGGRSSLRRLVADRPRRSLIDRLVGPGTVLAGLGSLVALALALVPAPDRPEASPEERAVEQQIHKVKEGDNLRGLAREYYDDPAEWRQIFLANREKLVRDGRLVPGDDLVIPVFAPGAGDDQGVVGGD